MGQAPELPDMPLPRCQAHLTGFLAYKSNLGAQRTVRYNLAIMQQKNELQLSPCGTARHKPV